MSDFLKKEVQFLGFTISKEGIKLSQDKALALREYPEPPKFRELRSFLGLSSYYGRFFHDYARLA